MTLTKVQMRRIVAQVLEELNKKDPTEERKPNYPTRTGHHWTDKEKISMANEFDHFLSVSAKKHQRTPLAIRYRVKELLTENLDEDIFNLEGDDIQ